MELKQIHTLTEMDAYTCTVPLYMYVHVHVYHNNVDVLMLCRKFELISIKFGFFYEFLKLLKNLAKVTVL